MNKTTKKISVGSLIRNRYSGKLYLVLEINFAFYRIWSCDLQKSLIHVKSYLLFHFEVVE